MWRPWSGWWLVRIDWLISVNLVKEKLHIKKNGTFTCPVVSKPSKIFFLLPETRDHTRQWTSADVVQWHVYMPAQKIVHTFWIIVIQNCETINLNMCFLKDVPLCNILDVLAVCFESQKSCNGVLISCNPCRCLQSYSVPLYAIFLKVMQSRMRCSSMLVEWLGFF